MHKFQTLEKRILVLLKNFHWLEIKAFADVPLEKEELITNKMVVQNTCGAYKCLRELMLQGFKLRTSSHLQTRVDD